MKEISRRTVAKGALWAAPAVVVASSAPAFAASQPILDFVMDAQDNFPGITSALPDGSMDYGRHAFVRLGIANVGTGTLLKGQQFRVTFNVTGTKPEPAARMWRYDWLRPSPQAQFYVFDKSFSNFNDPGPVERVFTLNSDLLSGQAVSMAPGVLHSVGDAAASMVATVLPAVGTQVQGNTVFEIDNILQSRGSWNITQY